MPGLQASLAYVVDGPQPQPHFSVLVLAEDNLPQPRTDLRSPDAHVGPRHGPHHPRHGRAGGHRHLLRWWRQKVKVNWRKKGLNAVSHHLNYS